MKKLLIIAALALGACSIDTGESPAVTTTKPAKADTPTKPAEPKEESVKPTTAKAVSYELQISGMT